MAAATPAAGTGAAAPSAYPAPRLAWLTMGMIGTVTIFGQMDRAIFYLLVSSIKRDLQFTDTQMSVLMGMAFSAAYLLCGLPIARATDVWKRKIILPGGLALWSFGTMLCGLSSTYVQLFVARLFVGGGESVKGPCSVSLISDLFERRLLPRAFAVYQFTIRLGESAAAIIGGLLIGFFAVHGGIDLPVVGQLRGWHMVFLCFALPGLFFALAFVLVVKEPARQQRQRAGSVPVKDFVRFLFRSDATPVLVPILLAAAVGMIEAVGVGSWTPVFYERTYGWTPDRFAPITGTITLVTAPLSLIAGAWFVERMHARGQHDANMRIVLWTQIIALPLAAAGPLMPSFWLAMACSLASQCVLLAATPASLAAMQVVTPNEMRAQVNAVYMLTISVLGQGLGPSAVALMTDYVFQNEADLRYAMLTAGLIANPISILLIWRTLKPYGAAYRRSEGLV